MRHYDEETLADLLRTLPAPPEAWVKAAQEIPLARRGLDDIVERAREDQAFREALIADLETALESAGYDTNPTLTEAVRARLSL
jgi:transposase